MALPETAPSSSSSSSSSTLTGLTTAQVEQALEQYGKNVIPTPKVSPIALFVRQFTGFLPLLILAAALISLAVEDVVDFGIILAILFLNACLGFHEEMHAKKALDELSLQLESEIMVRRNGGHTVSIHVSELVPGDICLVTGGTSMPADCAWVQGDTLRLDTSALTGETAPRNIGPGKQRGGSTGDSTDDSDDSDDNHDDEAPILSGMTVLSGEAYVRVVRTGLNTEMGRAHADVMRHKSIRTVSVFQQKVMTVVQWLLAFSLLIILTVFFIQGYVYDGFQENMKETILDSLSILIAAIPVALPLVLQINLALGASYLAKQHAAIVTSLPALQDIASMSMLCSDKTGTLTTAQMTVVPEKIVPLNDNDDPKTILQWAFLCSNVDKQEDPIDRAICAAAQAAGIITATADGHLVLEGYQQNKIIGFSPTTKRVVAVCTTPQGETITIAKGLPEKIIDTSSGGTDDHEMQWAVPQASDKAWCKRVMDADTKLNEAGYKTIAVAICHGDGRLAENKTKWQLVGLVPLLDPPREDTPATIAALHHANICVQMITGDHAHVGKETARLVGLGTTLFWQGQDLRNATHDEIHKRDMIWHADGFCTVLPTDKQEIVMTLRHSCGLVTGMTGDGVNDVAALSAAHVGIAVEGATDAAKNAADLILTKPGLSPIYGAVLESRRIFARIKSYVVYRVAASIGLVMSLAVILFATGCACDSLLIIILALINDVSMIPVAYDQASATTAPQLPHARKLVLLSLYYGVLHTILAVFFILTMLDVDKLADLDRCDIQSRGFIWLYMVIFTELMIFSVRAPSYFWSSMPSLWLVASVLLSCALACGLAVYRNDLNGEDVGLLWAWNIAVFVVIDLGKVCFRNLIGDTPGDTIASDVLLPPAAPKSEETLQQEKETRLAMQAHLAPADTEHRVQVGGRPAFFSDGFIQSAKRMSVVNKTGLSSPGSNTTSSKDKKNKATFKTPETELA